MSQSSPSSRVASRCNSPPTTNISSEFTQTDYISTGPRRTSSIRPGGKSFDFEHSFDKEELVGDAEITPNGSIDELPDIPEVIRDKNLPSNIVFQPMVKKRGRPKKSREGTPAKKKKNGNFIDGSESPTKKSQKQRKYVRGPYKTNKPKDSTLNR